MIRLGFETGAKPTGMVGTVLGEASGCGDRQP
jgi:hypothetical protein